MQRTAARTWPVALAFVIGIAFGHSHSVAAQEGSKDIGVVPADELVDRTPKSTVPSGGKSSTGKPSPSRRNYRLSKTSTKKPPSADQESVGVGVTIRRLRAVAGCKELGQQGQEAQLEQVAADAPLGIGSHVRIYLEPLNRDGFLYVVDREQFADGSYGTPKLIFPTLHTRGGNNKVSANDLIQIPRPPSYFCINPSTTGKIQLAEVLTVIISPTPLDLPAALSEHAMTLSADLFSQWEKTWSAPTATFEMEGGAGQVERSKDLDQIGEEAQTQEDPLPETVYSVTVKKGSPLFVTVPVRFKAH